MGFIFSEMGVFGVLGFKRGGEIMAAVSLFKRRGRMGSDWGYFGGSIRYLLLNYIVWGKMEGVRSIFRFLGWLVVDIGGLFIIMGRIGTSRSGMAWVIINRFLFWICVTD